MALPLNILAIVMVFECFYCVYMSGLSSQKIEGKISTYDDKYLCTVSP